MIMTPKQWEIKFKPGIKLNHNIYINSTGVYTTHQTCDISNIVNENYCQKEYNKISSYDLTTKKKF